jgi:hypothetical protein
MTDNNEDSPIRNSDSSMPAGFKEQKQDNKKQEAQRPQLNPGEQILRRSEVHKGIFHRHLTDLMEITNQAVILVKVHEDRPSDIYRYA